MDDIYKFELDNHIAQCEKLLVVFEQLPDGCFLRFKTSPSVELMERLKNKIHSLSDGFFMVNKKRQI